MLGLLRVGEPGKDGFGQVSSGAVLVPIQFFTRVGRSVDFAAVGFAGFLVRCPWGSFHEFLVVGGYVFFAVDVGVFRRGLLCASMFCIVGRVLGPVDVGVFEDVAAFAGAGLVGPRCCGVVPLDLARMRWARRAVRQSPRVLSAMGWSRGALAVGAACSSRFVCRWFRISCRWGAGVC